MITSADVRNALKAFIQQNSRGGNVLAKVKDVDETNNTCTLVDDLDESIEFLNVRLRPVIDGKEAVTMFPKVGTWAIAEKIEEGTDMIVVAVGEVQKVKAVVGVSELEITAEGFSIKKGETLGDILRDLCTSIQEITVNVTAVGSPTGVPINSAAFASISSRLNQVLL